MAFKKILFDDIDLFDNLFYLFGTFKMISPVAPNLGFCIQIWGFSMTFWVPGFLFWRSGVCRI